MALALFVISTPSFAVAEPLDKRASEAFRRGVAALQVAAFADAAAAFDESYKLSPKAASICNLALTYDRWVGHDAEALAAYRRCAEDDQSGRFRTHALERSKALRASIAANPPPTPTPVAPPEPLPMPVPITAPPPPVEPQPVYPPPQPPVLRPYVAQPPLPAHRRTHRLLYAGGGITAVGVIMLGAAIGLNVKVNNDIKALQNFVVGTDAQGRPLISDAHQGALTSAQQTANASRALYGVGGAFSVIGVSLMIVDAAIDF